MERRYSSRELSRERTGSTSLQKRVAENRTRATKIQHVPDLTDFMNDVFFGTVNSEKKAYNLTGRNHDHDHHGVSSVGDDDDDGDEDFEDSRRSNSSRLTQEWLEEARRLVASSPSRSDSPSRFVGSPRFGAASPNNFPAGGRLSASSFDRRDHLSRSARRHRAVEGFSGEILSKSTKHSRKISESLDSPTDDSSPTSAVQKWFTNILKPSKDPQPPLPPPRLSTYRKSRFKTDSPVPQPQAIPVTSRSSFTLQQQSPLPDTQAQLLSPPKTLLDSAHRRSIASSTCSLPDDVTLSPPRNLIESAHRRSISKSTCSLEKTTPRTHSNGWPKEEDEARELSLNGFLKKQRIKIEQILNGDINSKAKIVLSRPSNNTSSMVAALCYAWLLENRGRKNKIEGEVKEYEVFPVMNVRRGKMWKHRQAAWLFHHVGIDATSLLFADEVDLETLIMAGRLSILVVGQDVLKTNGEVGSQCTILTDNYCEDAYDLLQTPLLKKLLLAGILLDTQNLNASDRLSMTRDAEAVQLLLVGLSPNYRNAVFDQLMQDQKDKSFYEALQHSYGQPPSENGRDIGGAQLEHKVPEKKSTSISQHEQKSDKNSKESRNGKMKSVSPTTAKPNPLQARTPTAAAPAKPVGDAPRGKNKFFLAKWFGFGSK